MFAPARLFWRFAAAALAGALLLAAPVSARNGGRHARELAGTAAPAGESPGEAPREPGMRRRAHRGAGGANLRRTCHISVAVTASPGTVGETPTVFGQLLCEDNFNAASRQVTLYRRTRGSHTRRGTVVASAMTEADGSYRIAPPPFGTDSVFYVRADGVRSARVLARVPAQITLSGTPEAEQSLAGGDARSRVGTQDTIAFSGVVNPVRVGTLIALQRKDAHGDGKWRRIGLARVNADGSYAITHTFRGSGAVEVRAVLRGRGRHAMGASQPLTYEIASRRELKQASATSARRATLSPLA